MLIGWKDLTSAERRQDEIVLGKVDGESVYVQLAYSVAINKDGGLAVKTNKFIAACCRLCPAEFRHCQM